MSQTIGFVGLGAMGLPVARRLASAGHRLVVHDLDPAAVAAAQGMGAAPAADAGAVAGRCDLLMTCLPNPDAVQQVYRAVDRAGLLACDLSTIGPSLAIRLHGELAGRGVRYLECPMLGGIDEAADGRLFLILAGDPADVAEIEPLLGHFGRAWRYVGGPGSASRMKVVQNGLGLVQLAAIAEALAILARAGADLAAWCEVVAAGHGMADTPLFRAKAPEMLKSEPALKGLLRIAAKDIGLAAALAGELGVDAPLFRDAETMFRRAMAMGLGEADLAAIARAVEDRTDTSLSGG